MKDKILDPVLVWSFEHNAWWGSNHIGYTNYKALAGIYEREEAEEICFRANRFIPEGKINEEIRELR